ncbi:hypothetical protein QBC35DRAFT_498206 [Podospora australis]|uniref:Histidine-specific methyltransferase SAM-dependent domain-containing protein n=1 Tax=Podospora australis TaxID=1536484 RepID=A0AAN6WSP9_9PEZI|nr:hypothetical protein QBC35DRAFT_498206 [Podospora australis]
MPATTIPFNVLVAESIATQTNISPEKIIVLDNSDKYCPDAIKPVSSADHDEEKSLEAIFDTMAALNRAALSDQSLCTGRRNSSASSLTSASSSDSGETEPGEGMSFRTALLSATDELVTLAAGRPVRYVELGPEPWKSQVILSHLLKAGVNLRQYVGIDINPESERTMRAALTPIIGEERFAYLITDFYKTSADDLPPVPGLDKESVVSVMTNLGFQEGNDLPSRLGPMLTRLTKPGDLLLSEMQVLPPDDEEFGQNAVEEFYHLPEMLKFSSLVGKKFDDKFSLEEGKTDYEYIFNLVPLEVSEVGEVRVATTLVSLPVEGGKGKNYVLTNSCIKYTRKQFEKAREKLGKFGVRAERETGDRSVVFQIAERRD